MKTRKDILDAALKCVNGERDLQYGSPEDSFRTIAEFWNAYLRSTQSNGICLGSVDVAAMMALMKIARIATGGNKDDNWIDLAGYAACGGELGSISDGQKIVDESELKDIEKLIAERLDRKRNHELMEADLRAKQDIFKNVNPDFAE